MLQRVVHRLLKEHRELALPLGAELEVATLGRRTSYLEPYGVGRKDRAPLILEVAGEVAQAALRAIEIPEEVARPSHHRLDRARDLADMREQLRRAGAVELAAHELGVKRDARKLHTDVVVVVARDLGAYALALEAPHALLLERTTHTNAHAQAMRLEQHRTDTQDRKEREPWRAPERRSHVKRECEAGLVPHAIAIRRLDPKDVLAGIEVGVGRIAPLAAPHPVAVEAVEAIRILPAPRSVEVERRELEGDEVLAIRELDRPAGLSGETERHRAIELLERGQHYWRRIGIALDRLGPKTREAVHSAEEDLAARSPRRRARQELLALNAVGAVIAGEATLRKVEPREAAIGREPKAPARVLDDRVHLVAGEPIALGEALEGSRRRVETVGAAAVRAEPDRAVARDGQRLNRLVRHPARDAWRVEVVVERIARAIVAAESADQRAHPQLAPGIEHERGHQIGGQASRIVGIGVIDALASVARVEADQTLAAAIPDDAVRLLDDGGHLSVGASHEPEPSVASGSMETAPSSDPEASIVSTSEAEDRDMRERAIVHGNALPARVEAQQSSGASEPKCAVILLQDRVDL